MANLGVDTIKSEDGNRGPILDADLDFSQSAYTVLPKGTTAERPTGVAAGSLRFNTDTKLVEQYNGTDWVTLNSYGVGRGVFGGGYINSPSLIYDIVDYITIASNGTDASDFGGLTQTRGQLAACSSSTRGVFGGGVGGANTIDYITIATTGNATDFGDLFQARTGVSACSSSTRGVFGGGFVAPIFTNTIDYITIATTGNATDFGDLTQARNALSACSSSTRGVFGGGNLGAPATSNVIDYVTIASTGNATDFGDLTQSKFLFSACSNSTRGVFGGGITVSASPFPPVNTIEYITITSTGNASDFGDLTGTRFHNAACSSSTRGIFGGGGNPSINTIDYITIASNGTNAQDFGDLTIARRGVSACSDAHGGLA
jgi:hypothetical protein